MRRMRPLLPGMCLAVALAICYPRTALAAATIVPPQRIDSRGDVPYPGGASGDASVLLFVSVSNQGAVTDAAVKRGDPPFTDAAIVAVKGWLFTPATRDEVPVASRIAVEIVFHAPRPSAPPLPLPPDGTPGAPSPPTPGPSPPAEAPVVVSVRAEREEPGSNHIPRTDSRFMPGAFADPFRAVEALPGMAPWLSGLPYYYVRGAPPESVGYTLDGVPVPLLFHVGSGPATISPSLVDSVDLFSDAPPARYGRFTGAMITGETTRPNMEEAHAQAGARAFDANAFGEAPFDAGRGSAMAAGRYGYTGFLTKLVAPDYGVGYWDYQARVAHKTWGEDTATAFVFGARDDLDYRNIKFFHVEYHRLDLRYDHPVKDGNLRVAATLGYDDAFTAEQNDTGLGPRAALRAPGGRARVEYEKRLSQEARVRAGTDFGVKRFERDQSAGLSRGAHTDVESAAYADVVWRPEKRLELVPGLRADVYSVRGKSRFAPQPRFAARVRITSSLAWVSSLGVTHQEPTEEVFVPSKIPDPIELASRDGYHASEGLEVRLPSRIRLHGSAFYSRVFAKDIGAQERSYGAELFVRRDLSERLGGFFAYTLSRADTISGAVTERSLWDRTHLLSVALSYDLGAGFRAGARMFVQSGRPYRTQCPTQSCAPGSDAIPQVQASGVLPGFFRLDARLEKRWTLTGSRWIAASLECFNATNSAEPIGVSYTQESGLQTNYQSPVILPSIGVEAGF